MVNINLISPSLFFFFSLIFLCSKLKKIISQETSALIKPYLRSSHSPPYHAIDE